jgi:hypothetical protein
MQGMETVIISKCIYNYDDVMTVRIHPNDNDH